MKIQNWRSLKLKGKKVFLRALRKTDAERVFQLINDPKVVEYLVNFSLPVTLEKERRFTRETEQKWESGKEFRFAICEPKTKVVMGSCDLLEYHPIHKRAKVGIWIGKDYWGQRFGEEAVQLILKFGFEKLKLNRIQYGYLKGNKRSERIAQKIGTYFEGIERNYSFKHGRFWNHVVTSILVTEWKKKRRKNG